MGIDKQSNEYSDYMNNKTDPSFIHSVRVLDENGIEEQMPFNWNPEHWCSPSMYDRVVIGGQLIYQKKSKGMIKQ
jgi:hypothetical protein